MTPFGKFLAILVLLVLGGGLAWLEVSQSQTESSQATVTFIHPGQVSTPVQTEEPQWSWSAVHGNELIAVLIGIVVVCATSSIGISWWKDTHPPTVGNIDLTLNRKHIRRMGHNR